MRTQTLEKYARAALPILLMTSLGVTACSKGEKTSCLSPAAVSGLYRGDRSEGVTNDQNTWRLGAVITDKTTLREPGTYQGMVIGFGSTAGDTRGLDKLPRVGDPFNDPHLSRPVSRPHQEFLVKIGPGDVVFTARAQAETGSPDCSRMPDVNFGVATPLDAILQSSSSNPIPPHWS